MGGAGSGAAAFGGLFNIAEIFDGFVRRIAANEMDRVVLFRRTDPTKFGPVEFGFRAGDELFEIERRIERHDGQTVRFDQIVKIIRRDHTAGARHVLHDHRRVAGNMFADILCHQARPLIVAAARRRTDNHFEGFALIDIRLREYSFKVQGVQKFKARKMVSRGCAMTSLDKVCSSSPFVGATSHPCLAASPSKSGSAIALA